MKKKEEMLLFVLKATAVLPLVQINRADFLRREFDKYCDSDQIEIAIKETPAYAGIDKLLIDKIADNCIKFETNQVSIMSFVAGIPGGFALLGTVPADLAQYFGHILIITQKLMYLYGWDELFDKEGQLDDATTNLLILFLGIMFGVDKVSSTIVKLITNATVQTSKDITSKALTKSVITPMIQKITLDISVKINNKLLTSSVSKFVPIAGGLISGGLTFISFKKMSNRLMKHLSTLRFAEPVDINPLEDGNNEVDLPLAYSTTFE